MGQFLPQNVKSHKRWSTALLAVVSLIGCKPRHRSSLLSENSVDLSAYQPVVFINVQNPAGVPANFTTVVYNAVTQAFKDPVDRLANVQAEGGKTHVLGVLNDVDQSLGSAVSTGELSNTLANMGSESGELTLDFMFIPKDSQLVSSLKSEQSQSLKALPLNWQMYAMLLYSSQNSSFLPIVINGTSPNRNAVFQESFRAYKMMLADEQIQTLPVYASIDVSYNRQGVDFKVLARLKPMNVSNDLAGKPSDTVDMEMVSWKPMPTYQTDNPAVMGVTFERHYGAEATGGVPQVAIDFGRLSPNGDVRKVDICQAQCVNEIERVPTAIGQISEPHYKKAQQSGFMQFLTQAYEADVRFFTAGYVSFDALNVPSNVYVLFNHLLVNLSSESGPTVDAQDSSAYLILRDARPGQGGTVEIYPKQDGFFGYNLYNIPLPGGSIGSQIAGQVTQSIQFQEKQNIPAADAQLNKMLNPVVALYQSEKLKSQGATGDVAELPDNTNGADYLRIFAYRSWLGFDWSTPQRVAGWLLGNGAAQDIEHNIGHLDVELLCRGANHNGNETHDFVGQTGGFEMGSALLKGDGLGVLVFSYAGKLYDQPAIQKSVTEATKIAQRMASLTYAISPSTCERLAAYVQQYKAEQVYAHYGLPNRPRFKEGSGCSAFGSSFVDLAGLFENGMMNQWQSSINVPTTLVGNWPLHYDDADHVMSRIVNLAADPAFASMSPDEVAAMSPQQQASAMNRSVSATSVLSSSLGSRWANGNESYIPVVFFDPDKIYSWIVNQRNAAASNGTDQYGHPASVSDLGLVQGVTIDRHDAPTPTDPIFREFN